MWEKKSKCLKKNFQSVEREKKCKYRVSGVRKKKGSERKVPREKKSKCFGVEILLSSCSLVDLEVCKLNLRKKNGENFQSIFQVSVLKLKVWFAEKDRVFFLKKGGAVGYPVSCAPCCEPWLKKNGR